MGKIEKTASGKYRTRVFYQDKDGRHQKSITADTKIEVQELVLEFEKGNNTKDTALTVGMAMERYIKAKENVLSPTTIRAYITIKNNRFKALQEYKLYDLTNEILQLNINDETAQGINPKTVSNSYGLISSALKMFMPEKRFTVTLPTKITYKAIVPVDDDIKKLLAAAQGSDVELPIMLACMGSLRLGEIAPLLKSDIKESGISVTKSMVRTPQGGWQIKPYPKTKAGERVAPLPKQVISKLKSLSQNLNDTDRLFNLNPQNIEKHFVKIRNSINLPPFRFHDLRHYYASMAHLLGVPDQYIMQYGGWSDKSTLTKIYQQAQSDYTDFEAKKITSFFESKFKVDEKVDN